MSSTVSALLRDLVEAYSGLPYRDRMGLRGDTLPEGMIRESLGSAFLELLSAEDHKAVKQFHRGHKALLEAGDYEVDSEGERRRILDICTSQCRAYIEAGMISRAEFAQPWTMWRSKRGSIVTMSWTA